MYQSKFTLKDEFIFDVKFLYVQSLLLNLRASQFFIFFCTKIAINWSKITPKSWNFFCEFLVPPEPPAKFQRSSMICQPPPSLSTSVCPSVRPPQKTKKVFFCYRCYYQHWSRYLMSPVCRIFFLLHRVFCSLKEFFLELNFCKENKICSSFWECENSKLF